MASSILFLASTFPRFRKDAQPAFVLEQAQAWLAKHPEDDIHILAPHDGDAKLIEEWNGITVHRYRYFWPSVFQKLAYPAIVPNISRNPLLIAQVPFYILFQFFAVLRLIRREKISLVYAHWVMPQGVVAWLAKLFSRTPYILQSHSSDLKVFSKFGWFGHALARKLVEEAGALISVNKEQHDYALNLFNDEKREHISEKTHVLPMGVGFELESESFQLNGEYEFDIATISRLSKKKGLTFLLEGLGKLSESNVACKAVFAGSGEEQEALEAQAGQLDVSFPGYLTGAGKVSLFQKSRFFACPSVAFSDDVEGLPVSLLEALCLGKTVLVSKDTNITLMPEWEQLQPLVFYVEDPRDIDKMYQALRQMVALDGSEVLTRGEQIRMIMKRYFWSNLINEYLAIVRPIVKK